MKLIRHKLREVSGDFWSSLQAALSGFICLCLVCKIFNVGFSGRSRPCAKGEGAVLIYCAPRAPPLDPSLGFKILILFQVMMRVDLEEVTSRQVM